jgi:hypothetical protein
VGWLLLAVLVIMWAAFLVPLRHLRKDPSAEVADFERRMELLAYSEVQGTTGRWIMTPRKGVRFVGTAERSRARARDRRRRVFVFLLESITLSFLIGLVPPLRAMWYLTTLLGVLLVLYVWLLLSLKHRPAETPAERAKAARVPERASKAAATVARYVAEGTSRLARPHVNGQAVVSEPDRVHVTVRPAEQVARA